MEHFFSLKTLDERSLMSNKIKLINLVLSTIRYFPNFLVSLKRIFLANSYSESETIANTVYPNIPTLLTIKVYTFIHSNRLLSAIDGNVVFVHKCQLIIVSDKIINNSDNFRIIESYLTVKKVQFYVKLFSVLTLS